MSTLSGGGDTITSRMVHRLSPSSRNKVQIADAGHSWSNVKKSPMQTIQIEEERDEQASEHKAQKNTQAVSPSMQEQFDHKMRSTMRDTA